MLLEKMGMLQMEGVKDERCQRLVLDVEDWCWVLKIISQISGERRSKTGAGCPGIGCHWVLGVRHFILVSDTNPRVSDTLYWVSDTLILCDTTKWVLGAHMLGVRHQ